jgi:EAL domain-containing protein (putative c-di-GMP-specific phosphodiesterase class I)
VQDGSVSPVGRLAGQQITVGVPTYRAGHADPVTAVDVVLAYSPVARAISDSTRRVNLILIGAAILFYAVLMPRLLRASRALRSQNDPRKQALMRELSTAIDRDELLLHYQPTIDLADGTVVAVEALLRWQHPKRGLLAPSEFLPTINDSALTGRLTLRVTEIALGDCAAWRERGIDAGVNVNLSARNALDEKLPERIGKLLATSGIPADALGLELTEGAIAANPETAGQMLRSLARMGVRIAIDDFGTGYSSLAGLRDLPVSELKVDRSFVAGLIARPRDAAIVRSTIQLAHELDVEVIAEGVEDQDTVQELAALGCDMAQGYYFSPPQPLSALIEWFEAPLIAGRSQTQEPTPAIT